MIRHLITGALILFATEIAPAATSENSTTSPRAWDEYQVIMWMGDSAFKAPEKFPLVLERLREMGVNAGMAHGEAGPEPFVEHKFPYYVENIVNRGLCLKWNSKVRDWDASVTSWAKGGRSGEAFVREYCFDDPEWQNWSSNQVRKIVLRHRGHKPLAYDLRDELSVTISANPFDYDFHPLALAGFRRWLKSQYRTLDELNAEWETRFVSWETVTPFSTDQIKARMAEGHALPVGNPAWSELAKLKFSVAEARKNPTRWNFAPWADFRTYMDISLAETLGRLRSVASVLDRATPVGIEGTQMPHAFGGYDLWRLSQVLDWVEPYDIGNAREIFGSFMPGKTIVTTVFEKETRAARRRLWHLLLEGDRGCIIWWSEDCIDWRNPEYPLTGKARALEPVLKELRSPVARLFMRAQPVRDSIYLHYSQASIQANWLIESTVDGASWYRRFSSYEASQNQQAKTRNAWLKVFQDLGYSPQFVSTSQVESGAMRNHSNPVLVLPTSWALSDREQAQIESLLQDPKGPVVFYDGVPGVFNGHGRLRDRSLFERLDPGITPGRVAVLGRFPNGKLLPEVFTGPTSSESPKGEELARYAVQRLRETPELSISKWLQSRLASIQPEVSLDPQSRVRVHRYAVKAGRLFAFERNIDYHMSEDLKQAGGNEALEKKLMVTARLNRKQHLYDLKAGRYLGDLQEVTFEVDAFAPTLLAALPEKLPAEGLVDRLLSATQ